MTERRHPSSPPMDPYVATWARIITAIVVRERAEEAERRRSMAVIGGGKERAA